IHDDELIVLTAYAQNRRSEKSVFVKLIRDPEISFYATENAIINTQATCLKWDVQHATSVTIEPELGIVPAKGSRDINPDKSITYTLTATGNDGVPHVKTAQITVFPTPVITNLIIPMPDNLRIETAITKISLPVPSLLNLSLLDRVEFHFARINAINTAYLPAKPSLRTVAESIPMPEEELKQDLRRIKSDLKSVTRRIPRY
nr:hypothetical protein [Cyclobacteriaceae bacterium]